MAGRLPASCAGFVVAIVWIGDQVEPVKPHLMTASTSSSDTPLRLSIS
jgi:hypothetical protein